MNWLRFLEEKNQSQILIFAGALLTLVGFICFGPWFLTFVDQFLRVGPDLSVEKAYYLKWAWVSFIPFGLLFLAVGLWPKKQPAAPTTDSSFLSTPAKLILVSFLVLFVELLIIRWFGQEVKLIGYFKNLSLVCCFLGLGIGCLLATSQKSYWASFPVLLSFTAFLGFSGFGKIVGLLHTPLASQEVLWPYSMPPNHFYTLFFYTLIPGFFLLFALVMVPLGQRMGSLMHGMPALRAYSLNILGSLLGVLAFWLMSALWLPPWFWFLIVFALYGLILTTERITRVMTLSLGLGVVIFGAALEWGSLWSPYYRIDVYPMFEEAYGRKMETMPVRYFWDPLPRQTPLGYGLMENLSSFTEGIDLSDERLKSYKNHPPHYFSEKERFEYPFRVMRPKNVLIIGVGLGSDIAAALRYGVEEIDAVEIDPLIAKLAKDLHPEKPLDNPKVRVIVQDGRAFLKSTNKKYDQVIFSAVDSHTLLSGMSSIRLDNYLYTIECFQSVRRVLNEKGTMFLFFSAPRPWIWTRIDRLAHRAFPGDPMWTVFGGMLLVGPGLQGKTPVPMERGFGDFRLEPEEPPMTSDALVPTDSWPYLYLKDKSIPVPYLVILGLIVFAAFCLIPLPKARWNAAHGQFFFLGAGFLLLETKAITELSLLFGATWTVNSAVFAIVLAMILFGNAAVAWLPIRRPTLWYLILFLALGAQMKITPADFYGLSDSIRWLAIAGFYGLPFLMASLIFAQGLQALGKPDEFVGINLLGAILGGVLEYVSLFSEIRMLAVGAIAMYACAYFFSYLRQRSPSLA